jgi:Low specificity phosphatase (HAD superfamily)
LRLRLKALGVEHAVFGTEDKRPAAEQMLASLGFSWSQAAAMGDDWPDLPVMRRCALACAPANAHVEVRHAAHHTTVARGGEGAAREFVICCWWPVAAMQPCWRTTRNDSRAAPRLGKVFTLPPDHPHGDARAGHLVAGAQCPRAHCRSGGPSNPHQPDYFMKLFSVKSFDATGRMQSEIKGEMGRHYPDTDTWRSTKSTCDR